MPGDSFNWSWVRSLDQVKYLAIHHSASPDTQTPFEIANYHINSNGWGGIGYHFLVDKNGVVYYVGDISTARANVANLNDQVIGICLIGNFTQGQVPTDLQLDSTGKLCDFFINNFPQLNLGWDSVLGHKELPGQATACPGDSWPSWKVRIAAGSAASVPASGDLPSSERKNRITEAYRSVLGREPDMEGLRSYISSSMGLDQIIWSMVASDEHKEVLRLAREAYNLKDQLESMQTSLNSINSQVLILQESLQQKDREIEELRSKSLQKTVSPDTTLTVLGVLINIFKFLFLPRKAGVIG